ncbi:Protein of uncharacterised function (DUF3275) [Pseudomonas aeruginosa]|nr:Protein of uncharacterised function (DUF3275) [Pseudomonas aeruginosa]
MINIPGQLAIRTINGRNGEFNVGKLSTSIGEFVIKDALLDQHIEGKYRGDFAITEIRPSYYTTGGRLVVEIRAKLDSMTLDDVDNLSDEEAERLSGNEVDPLDEVPAIQQPTVPPAVPRSRRRNRSLCAPLQQGRTRLSVCPSGSCRAGRHSGHRRRCRAVRDGLAARRNRQAGHHGRPQAATSTVRAARRAGL